MFHPSLTQAIANERNSDLVKAAAAARVARSLGRRKHVPGTHRGR